MSKFTKMLDFKKELLKFQSYNNKNMYYGLIGEERVAYQLLKCNSDIICMHNIRLKINGFYYQFDFIILTNDKIYILEVKNLLGNITINEDLSVERQIRRAGKIEKYGIENPIIQLDEHKQALELYFEQNGFNKLVEPYLVMGNDKTVIYNYSLFRKIVKYEEIKRLFESIVINSGYREDMIVLSNKILKDNVEYNYKQLRAIKQKVYFNEQNEEYSDEIYDRLFQLRKKYAILLKQPACNIFNNVEAKRLHDNKPQSREEFIKIKGFKEKRFELFGEEIIKIFKKI